MCWYHRSSTPTRPLPKKDQRTVISFMLLDFDSCDENLKSHHHEQTKKLESRQEKCRSWKTQKRLTVRPSVGWSMREQPRARASEREREREREKTFMRIYTQACTIFYINIPSEALPAPSEALPAPSEALSAPSEALPAPFEALPAPSEE